MECLAKSLILAPRVFAHYGCLHPSRVQLFGYDHWVHIVPTDQRAVKKFVHDPLRGRVSPPAKFWSAFNKHLQPAVAVDVGVNFGERLFGVRYAEKTLFFGFEANPRIVPFLEKNAKNNPTASA